MITNPNPDPNPNPNPNPHPHQGAYEGWYSIRDEAFYTEDELIDGLAPTGAPVEWVAESSYFFALSKFRDPIVAHIEAHPEFIQPTSRRNEALTLTLALALVLTLALTLTLTLTLTLSRCSPS